MHKIRMMIKCDLCGFNRGIVVGARQTSFGILKELLGFVVLTFWPVAQNLKH